MPCRLLRQPPAVTEQQTAQGRGENDLPTVTVFGTAFHHTLAAGVDHGTQCRLVMGVSQGDALLHAAKLTVQLVREGKADIPMKGILQTSNFARAILNRETGLIPASGKRLVSQCGIFEYEGRFVMITDAAINIAPDVDTQIGIVENALPVANALGIECPKVAVLSAVENVTEKMPSTVSAKEIAERGVPGCVISGPLALDGAISMESVKHKAIHDPVAGQADILLVPYIEIGNVLYKACTYIAGKTMASTICGASCPVVITSRADTPDSKYYSILLAVLRCLKA